MVHFEVVVGFLSHSNVLGFWDKRKNTILKL